MRILAATLLAASCLATVSATGCAVNLDASTTASVPFVKRASSVMRVDLADGGHGSGVDIGGIVITAGHVAKDQTSVLLHLDNGTVQSAEVLWINTKYDVAALAPIHPDQIESSTLSCTPPVRGDSVVTAGSPGGEDDLYIPGTIAGNERRSEPWESVVIAAMPATGGISGGAVFDKFDQVVGITVGGMIGAAYIASDGKPDLSQTGLSYIVPGSAICGLLGRA